VDAPHIPQCNLINPPIPLGEDNVICSKTDIIHGVVNPDVNPNINFTGVDNNTDTTYGANNNNSNDNSKNNNNTINSNKNNNSKIN
jgi:hypothetical protein